MLSVVISYLLVMRLLQTLILLSVCVQLSSAGELSLGPRNTYGEWTHIGNVQKKPGSKKGNVARERLADIQSQADYQINFMLSEAFAITNRAITSKYKCFKLFRPPYDTGLTHRFGGWAAKQRKSSQLAEVSSSSRLFQEDRTDLCSQGRKTTVWPRNIICGPLREQILFAYPTNLTANMHWEKITSVIWSCDLKRVTMWNH